MFVVIGYDGTDKIVYWNSTSYLDTALVNGESFRSSINKAINEFPHKGVYIENPISYKAYEVGYGEDIDVSNVFGEYEANPVTVTLEGNTDPSAVTATLVGSTLTLTAIGITETSATITLKGESSVNFKTESFEVYTNDPGSFLGMDQGFESSNFPPPFWELKYNTLADGGLNGANLIDPPTSDTWFGNTSFNPDFGADYIHSDDNSAVIMYWAENFHWLISPDMELDFDDYFLKFWLWFDSDPYASKFHVLVDDGTKGWTSILDYDGVTPDNRYDSVVELSLSAYFNQTIRIAFVFEGTYGENIALDDITITSPTDIDNVSIPVTTILDQNYPNPFNPSTMINFSVEKRSSINLSIFNQNGQLVNTIFDGEKEPGNYSITYEANGLSAGIYYYTLTTGDDTISKKMIFIK
ncbi:MAG: T9SS type A sorting domain-containing protein [Candidatus Delongbacteria bacterium]|nr:T9SS type A sorting domain-containing protein [Candidatus Delongbacteria bacterium]